MIPEYAVMGVEKPFADESDCEDKTTTHISGIPPPSDITTKCLPETVTGLRKKIRTAKETCNTEKIW